MLRTWMVFAITILFSIFQLLMHVLIISELTEADDDLAHDNDLVVFLFQWFICSHNLI
jgi:hypothetical protein